MDFAVEESKLIKRPLPSLVPNAVPHLSYHLQAWLSAHQGTLHSQPQDLAFHRDWFQYALLSAVCDLL